MKITNPSLCSSPLTQEAPEHMELWLEAKSSRERVALNTLPFSKNETKGPQQSTNMGCFSHLQSLRGQLVSET